MFKIELMPTNTPKAIKLQYNEVLKSFFWNLRKRKKNLNTNEATRITTIIPTIPEEKNNITVEVLPKFILFTKIFLSPVKSPFEKQDFVQRKSL